MTHVTKRSALFMLRLFVTSVVVLFLVLASAASNVLAQPAQQTFPIVQTTYIPYVSKPALTNVYVDNQTGGQLCFEILNGGVGEKCFGGGENFYGTIYSGTYTYVVTSTECGSMTKTAIFLPGDWGKDDYFYCG